MKHFILSAFVLLTCTSLFAQDCAELFISQYVEAGGNDKAIQIYNPTSAAINLSTYSVKRYRDGAFTAPTDETWQLAGIIQPYGIFTVVNGQVDSQFVTGNPGYWSPAITDSIRHQADMLADTSYPGPFYFNGNDAITLEKNDVPVDIFGIIGQDPTSGAWTSNASSTPIPFTAGGKYLSKNMTLKRKASVKKGITNTQLTTFNALAEYDTLGYKNFSQLRYHHCDCNPAGISDVSKDDQSVTLYPNPATDKSFTVFAKENITEVFVYNILGSEVAHTVYNNNSNRVLVETGHLSAGSYITATKLQSGTTVTKKLVIQ